MRQAQANSLVFVRLVSGGYAIGVLAKLALWQTAGVLSLLIYVALSLLIYVYAWNFMVTLTDLALLLSFRRRARRSTITTVVAA